MDKNLASFLFDFNKVKKTGLENKSKLFEKPKGMGVALFQKVIINLIHGFCKRRTENTPKAQIIL